MQQTNKKWINYKRNYYDIKISILFTFYFESKHQLSMVQEEGNVLQHVNNTLLQY